MNEVDFFGTRPLPPKPTLALPGTIEKIRVMRKRLREGLHIHHPEDATLQGVIGGQVQLLRAAHQKARRLPKGVRRWRQRFQARLFDGSKGRHLGLYDTPEEAAAAIVAARNSA
jgi:hypothetical protein